MEKFPEMADKNFDIEKSPLREAYLLLGATTPLELNKKYSAEDQRIMKDRTWDYNNPELITNRIKEILETVGTTGLSEEEINWRDVILWFWYHHAISCAIWRYKDKVAAQKYSAHAIEFGQDDFNKITRLLYYLTRDQLDEAEKWTEGISEEPEKSTAAELIEEYKTGKFYSNSTVT